MIFSAQALAFTQERIMTEYEIASLYQNQGSQLGGVVMNYFTLVTAYLVAGYVAAHRINLTLSLLVTGLFTVGSAFFILVAYGVTLNLGSMAGEIRAIAQSERGLAWHRAAALPPSSWDAMLFVVLAMTVGGFIAAVCFFFYCRRQNASSSSDRE
jgi:hypothetical protein